jgi:zinc protease
MKIVRSFLIVVIIMSNLSQVKSEDKQSKKASFVKEVSGIKEYKLNNGLKILLKPDANTPSFSWQVWYKVGSRNEALNYTGIAHYLEHIMFKGTSQFEKGEIAQAIQLRGGIFNAFTGDDYTAYFENFSPENLELAIKIEADRMRNAKIDKNEVELERSVIVSELEGNRNSPFSILYENLKAQAFSVHTYRNPIIGWRDDLDNINSEKVKEFYDTFYYPDNAVAILVGNFDEALALDLIERYFDSYERNPKPLPKVPQEPVQKGLKRMTIYNKGYSTILGIAFHIPEFVHKDSATISLIGDIVFNGLSSRLYPKLVDSGLATSVSGVSESSIDASLFRIVVNLSPDADIKKVEDIIDRELDAIKNEVSIEELNLAKAKEKSSFIYQRDGAYDEGMQIGYFEALSGDWTTYTTWLDKINAVTVDQIKEVAKKYFVSSNKTAVSLLPVESPKMLAETKIDEKAKKKKQEANYGAGVADPISPAKFEKLMRITDADFSKNAVFPKVKVAFQDLSKDNIRFYFKQDSSLPLVYANFALYAGNASEDKPGLAYITSEMLMRGSKNFDKFSSSKLLDLYGADISFSANREYARIHFSTVSDDLEKVLEILKDNLENPSFDEEELFRLKELVISRLKQEDDSPQRVVGREISQLIYPSNHPFFIPDLKDRIKAIETLKIDDVKKFYKQHYNSKNLFVSIVGDLSETKAKSIVNDLFLDLNADLKNSKNEKPKIESIKVSGSKHKDIINPEKTQSEIAIAHATEVDRSHKDFYPLYMANYALGGSPLSSRLGTVVRDENGLVYNVRSGFDAGIAASMYRIDLGCNPKNVTKAISITKKTTEDFLKSGISEVELNMTKSYLTGSFPVRTLSSMESLSETMLQMLIYDLGANYINNYNTTINSVSKEQVDNSARKYIKPENFSSVIVGPKYE